VVVVASIDAAPPEVPVFWLQEGGVQALHGAVPHADEGAAPVEATILVQTINLRGEGREQQGSRAGFTAKDGRLLVQHLPHQTPC